MEKYEKIVKFIKKTNNAITASDFKDNKISYYYINKLINDNYIKRLAAGIYGKTDNFDDEYFILQTKCKSLVFSYNTALFFLGETEVTPDKIDVTIPREYNTHRFGEEIKAHYISKENLKLGMIKLKSPYGNEINVYNLERTICDIVKNENSLDKEQINKIIRNCFATNKINGTLLIDYAKKLKCEKKIRTIMEIMI